MTSSTEETTPAQRRRQRRPRRPRQRLSDLLNEIAADDTRERLSIGELVTLLRGRAIAALLLLFSFPNVLPAPPGTSGLLGMPLVYLSAQMMLGHRPWLPKFIADRSLTRSDFATIVTKFTPWLEKAERLLAPRLYALTSTAAIRTVGAFCLILSVVLILPIPLGNMLPALAICVLALGVMARDGVWIVAGTVIGTLSLVVVSGVIWAFIRAAMFLLSGEIIED